MAAGARGHVDFDDAGFIVRFNGDPTAVAMLKDIQRRRWNADRVAWIVASHGPSVRRLLHIAAELGWTISAEARAAEARVREESESLEYELDVVHDNHGAAWFICKTGDDDELRHLVSALPNAFWDDAWWIPTDWEQCCQPLLELVQSDMRFTVSPAAWRLLEEEDVTHLFVRSKCSEEEPALSEHEPEVPAAATRRTRVAAHNRLPTTQLAAARLKKNAG